MTNDLFRLVEMKRHLALRSVQLRNTIKMPTYDLSNSMDCTDRFHWS